MCISKTHVKQVVVATVWRRASCAYPKLLLLLLCGWNWRPRGWRWRPGACAGWLAGMRGRVRTGRAWNLCALTWNYIVSLFFSWPNIAEGRGRPADDARSQTFALFTILWLYRCRDTTVDIVYVYVQVRFGQVERRMLRPWVYGSRTFHPWATNQTLPNVQGLKIHDRGFQIPAKLFLALTIPSEAYWHFFFNSFDYILFKSVLWQTFLKC